ncbi:cell envelope integrity protein TolA [Sulfurivirga sp.]|uniref:cell envelope integrity protein TolA n=1 Tax=Sulfurivirga sp. TaxID=2614236 RepID=UPI0025CD0A70|nr:cell envelope integrity protein TolA [Sulfurivirga sp.]
MIRFVLRHPLATLAALAVHGLLFILLWWNWSQPARPHAVAAPSEPGRSVPSRQALPPMKTFAVDQKLVQQQLEKIRRQEAAKRRRAEELKRQAEAERRRLAALKRQRELERRKAEEARRKAEAERQRLLAEKKKAEALKKAAEEAARKKAEAERKARELKRQQQLAAEKKRRLEEELRRKAEEKKRLEEAARQARLKKEQEEEAARLREQLLAEERQRQEAERRQRLAKLRELYISQIAARVKENWRTPARISPDAQCDLEITQKPDGKIVSVKVLNCNKAADKPFRIAAERAVWRTGTLPPPPEKELFEPTIRFVFKP